MQLLYKMNQQTIITLEFDGELHVPIGGRLAFQVQSIQQTAIDPLLSQEESSAIVDDNHKNGKMTVSMRSTPKERERRKSSRKRRSRRILSKDDEVVIELREGRRMKWKEIGKYFPARSVG